MAEPSDYGDDTAFLRGGGATGDLIARFDWTATSLGPLSAWPARLRSAVSMILHAPVAMALIWGEDGVMIYNDAYAQLVGERHPGVLGAKVHDAWPEFTDFDEQMLAAVLGGAALEFRDQPLMLRRGKRAELSWFNLDYSAVPDESGRPVGVLSVVVETTQRVLAERKAAVRVASQRRMFDQAPGFICIVKGPNHIIEFANQAFWRLFGGADAVGRPTAEALPNYAEQGLVKLLDRVHATGERFIGRALRVHDTRPDGTQDTRFVNFILQPMTSEDGQNGIFIEGFDVTQQVQAQAAAEESNRRLSAAVGVARLGAFVWDRVTRAATLDARAHEIFGFAPDELVTIDDMVARIDPVDRERVADEVARSDVAREPRREVEYRIRLPDGTIRNIISMSDVLGGPHGPGSRASGVFNDVTERRAAENRQRLLINELNHRVKNTLATVQSIAAQTMRSAPDLLSARDAFESRLVALAAAHDLLTTQSWHGAPLCDVVATAMAPFETIQRPQISRSGPPVWLAAPRALALSLALHELATSAAKYGARSVPEGHSSIRWTLCGEDLVLSWIETGGPAVRAPQRSGFGSRLLERSLPHELQGRVELTYAPEGVRCEIRCPAEQLGAPHLSEPAKV